PRGGAAWGTRPPTEAASARGSKAGRVSLGGGGPRSPLWLQIHADILKQPVRLARESESCALGSAMAATLAAGIYRDFDQAAAAMVAIETVVEPNPAKTQVYADLCTKSVDHS